MSNVIFIQRNNLARFLYAGQDPNLQEIIMKYDLKTEFNVLCKEQLKCLHIYHKYSKNYCKIDAAPISV